MDFEESQPHRAWWACTNSQAKRWAKEFGVWFRAYGRVSGPHSGPCISGIPVSAVQAFTDALLHGDEIPVHLMHRHVSGKYESSRLLFDGKRLWMRFDDRTELA